MNRNPANDLGPVLEWARFSPFRLRPERGKTTMDMLLQDVRYALRTLGRAPAFTVAAVLSLALGIGANTAIFTVFNSALLRPLPVTEPKRLVTPVTDRGENDNPNFSFPHYQALRESGVFQDVFAHTPYAVALRIGNATEQIDGAAVTPNFFQLLGVGAAHGRLLQPGEPLDAQAIVLGYRLWRRLFHSRTDAIGSTIQLNGQPFTVVGVAEESFAGVVRGAEESYWIPLGTFTLLSGSNFLTGENAARISWLNLVARMKPGLTTQATQARLANLDRTLHEQQLMGADHFNRIESAERGFTAAIAELRQPLLYLSAAVAVVLLIACANVANLLLVRAAARKRDLAIRVALGSSRAQLARQLLTESLVLALIAGGAGLLLAIWLSDALATYRPAFGGQLVIDTAPDARVLLFTLGISLATGLIFGAGPALHTARTDLMSLLKQGSARGTGAWAARNALVVAQVALSLVLLVGATLLTRTLRQLGQVDLGFSTRTALLAAIDLDAAAYQPARGRLLVQQLLERMRNAPGVIDASAATTIHPSPAGSRYDGVTPEGYTPATDESVGFDLNVVDPRYFSTMGLPLVAGRTFSAQDVSAADPAATRNVAIINREMARRYWPIGDAIGKRIWLDTVGGRSWEVIGIAGNSKFRGLRESGETNVWRPISQSYRPALTLILHTRGDPLRLADLLRNELRAVDPAVPLYDVRTLEQHIGFAAAQERMATRLAAGFSLLALVLAAIGLYGMLAYFVTQRTRDLGVRMALGAHRADVLRHVMQRGLGLVAIGIAAGLPLALWTTRLLASMLYGVAATDPGSIALAALVLAAAGTLAVLLPARRAAAIDPMTALRAE